LQLEIQVGDDSRYRVSWVARFARTLQRFPASLFFISLSVLCYPLTWGIDQGEISPWLHYFTYTDFALSGDRILFAPFGHGMEHGQIWRLWTPMLIHFGLVHITFNLLWLWEIGRRIELLQGPARVFNLVMITALVSNGVQHLMSGAVLFGGMSGVVYGLLGYALVWSRLRPARSFGLPNGIYVFMLLWLALGFSGLIDVLGFGSIANGAHLGGLVAGAAVGLIAVLLSPQDE
jgi:GlpG protein